MWERLKQKQLEALRYFVLYKYTTMGRFADMGDKFWANSIGMQYWQLNLPPIIIQNNNNKKKTQPPHKQDLIKFILNENCWGPHCWNYRGKTKKIKRKKVFFFFFSKF